MKKTTRTAITPQPAPAPLALLNDLMQQAGQAANTAAARATFTEHTSRKASNTTRRKRADLALFESFLHSVQIPARDLFTTPQAWQGVTWGIVESFKAWMLKQGYAIASINGRLSTVRTYARLAAKAGAIDAREAVLIASVAGFAHKEKNHIDQKRKAEGIDTRRKTKAGILRKDGTPAGTSKKAQAVPIPATLAESIITQQPDTPQGKRDKFLLCLLLQHGLRVGEIAILTKKNFDMQARTFTFYRPKVNKTQTHKMTQATRNAARAYLPLAPAAGIVWRKTCKGTGKLSSQMSERSAARALSKRVELLGRKAGIKGLSAHDARHFWATYEADHETPVNRLMEAGGWMSPVMPLRYIEAAAIANTGTARIKAKRHKR